MTATSVCSVVPFPTRTTPYRPSCHLGHRPCALTRAKRRCIRVCALEEDPEEESVTTRPSKRSADSTDAVASFLTRRFGYLSLNPRRPLYQPVPLCSIGAGFAWLAILAVGSLGEQIKTRLEVKREEEGAKDIRNAKTVSLPSGVQYRDQKIGGGSRPYKGALTAIYLNELSSMRGSLEEDPANVFEDSFASGKQIVFLFGSRPLSDALCIGLEEAMETMQAGGIREVTVPPEAGFGSKGTVLFAGTKNERRIPSDATLSYLVELKRVSIAP